jgi:O-methyltransferase involved in polyketide biosynthesis
MTTDGLRCRMADSEVSPEPAPTPSQARIYDYLLGGHNNLPVDREVADAMIAHSSIARPTAVENRRFLGRAVRFLAAEAGIRQFLDVGAGLPTQQNVHQIARQAAADARVVYVDNDPAVVATGRALLTDEDRVAMVEGDLRQPAAILAIAEVRRLLDLRQPVALLLFGVLYFVPEEEDPDGLIAQLRDALAPGSYLAISHATGDFLPSDQLAEGTRIYNRASDVTMRSRARIERFFAGFDLIDPGLVLVTDWHPDSPQPPPDETPAMFGAIGRLRPPS